MSPTKWKFMITWKCHSRGNVTTKRRKFTIKIWHYNSEYLTTVEQSSSSCSSVYDVISLDILVVHASAYMIKTQVIPRTCQPCERTRIPFSTGSSHLPFPSISNTFVLLSKKEWDTNSNSKRSVIPELN